MSYLFDVQKTALEMDDEEDEEDAPVLQSRFRKAMVPLEDTLNADSAGHNACLMYLDYCLVMRSIKSIAHELLRHYGYVERDGCAHDFTEVTHYELRRYFNPDNDTFDAVVQMLLQIEDDEAESFVLESCDCLAASEVIFELTFVVQVL
ncbi:hypothetical protein METBISCDRAFT_29060, partial [Metschnikowia bicuspidata]